MQYNIKIINRDIIQNLFDFLSIEDLFNLKISCKYFCNLVDFFNNKKLISRMDWKLITREYNLDFKFLKHFGEHIIWKDIKYNKIVDNETLLQFSEKIDYDTLKAEKITQKQFEQIVKTFDLNEKTWHKILKNHYHLLTPQILIENHEILDIKYLLKKKCFEKDVLLGLIEKNKNYIDIIVKHQKIDQQFIIENILKPKLISGKKENTSLMEKYLYSRSEDKAPIDDLIDFLYKNNETFDWVMASEYISQEKAENYKDCINWDAFSGRHIDEEYLIKYHQYINFKIFAKFQYISFFTLKRLEKYIEKRKDADKIWRTLIKRNKKIPKNMFEKYIYIPRSSKYIPEYISEKYNYTPKNVKYAPNYMSEKDETSNKIYLPNSLKYLAFDELNQQEILNIIEKNKDNKELKDFVIILLFSRKFSKEFVKKMQNIIDKNYMKICINILYGSPTKKIYEKKYINITGYLTNKTKTTDSPEKKIFLIYRLYYIQAKYFFTVCEMKQEYRNTIVYKFEHFNNKENVNISALKEMIDKLK